MAESHSDRGCLQRLGFGSLGLQAGRWRPVAHQDSPLGCRNPCTPQPEPTHAPPLSFKRSTEEREQKVLVLEKALAAAQKQAGELRTGLREAEQAAVDTQRQLQELRRQVRVPPGPRPQEHPHPRPQAPRALSPGWEPQPKCPAQTRRARVGPASETQGHAPNSLA